MSEKIDNVYIDEKTGNAIFAKKKENGSYSFYGTRKNDDGSFCINELKPINDIFDYIEKNKIDVKILSKKDASVGGKNGK